ncbi:hypothetical protein FOV72_07600 [Gordonia rubripertincta]|uniref:hypothetical protein n=1 Tax=Gordonia rubripertincta TaxID=36822 RepID=UPI0011809F4B|nr:hypothetical protein [Gordonia rubripertincta]TSD97901.1 hypothetical protein FOV72_07600 [Gordonia rubripertincta]
METLTKADIENLDFSVVRCPEPSIGQYEDWGSCEKVGLWGVRRGASVDGSELVEDARGLGLMKLLNAVREGARGVLPGPVNLHDECLPIQAVRNSEVSNRSNARARASVGRALRLFASRVVYAAVIGSVVGLFIFAANHFDDEPIFAEGSVVDLAWGLALAPILSFLIDIVIGIGKDGAFQIGAVVGTALFLYISIYKGGLWDEFVGTATEGPIPMDMSMFWVAPFAGVSAYLLSALFVNRN